MPSPSPQKSPLYVVIMAGGKGRRFWPKSRESRPKQILAIGTKEPLVRETFLRLLPIVPKERIFISCGKDLFADMRRIMPEVSRGNYILEPAGRDTAPCIGLSIETVLARAKTSAEQAVIAVLPADHSIKKPAAFRSALNRAARLARQKDSIVTLGIVPGHPSESYGYIRPGAAEPGMKGAFRVKDFREKPDAKTAARYVRNGYLWNAGMFVFRAEVMKKAFNDYLPGIAKGMEKIAKALASKDADRAIERIFPGLEKISIDFGIMEKAGNVAVVPGDFGWCDVGGWDALYRLLGGDGKKNVTAGPAEIVDSRGCLVDSERLVGLIGLDDVVVIDTPDALLVVRRDREADIKKLIERLEKKGLKEVL